jgi:hypothetical protein
MCPAGIHHNPICASAIRSNHFFSVPHQAHVVTAIHIGVEALHRIPDRHVDDDHGIVECPNSGSVPVLGLQPPHESWRPLRHGIDVIELRDEARDQRIVDWGPHKSDVELREVMRALLHDPLPVQVRSIRCHPC